MAVLSALGALGRGAVEIHDALAVLAGATARRKRVAYAVLAGCFLVLVAGVVADVAILEPGDIRVMALAALVNLVALIVLFWARQEFYARVRQGSVRRAALVFLCSPAR